MGFQALWRDALGFVPSVPGARPAKAGTKKLPKSEDAPEVSGASSRLGSVWCQKCFCWAWLAQAAAPSLLEVLVLLDADSFAGVDSLLAADSLLGLLADFDLRESVA